MKKWIALIVCGAELTACSRFRTYKEYTPPAPPVALPADLSAGGKARQGEGLPPSQVVSEAPEDKWWESFGDPLLSRLVTETLQRNQDLAAAQARLEAARAQERVARSGFLPEGEASASAARRYSSAQNGPLFLDRSQDSYAATASASWEPDLFGRIKRGTQAAGYSAEARAADVRAVRVSLAGAVASAYFNLRGSQRLLAAAKRNAEIQQKSYDLAKTIAGKGRSGDLDVARAKTRLEQTLAAVPTWEANLHAAINSLATLTGRPAAVWRSELEKEAPFPEAPATVRVGEAETLLRRRPDVASAERDLAAATARYNVAVADLYPRVTISGNLGFTALSFAKLATAGAFAAALSPSITWSAFNMARVEASIDAADAQSKAALAAFRQTALRALEETDSAVRRFAAEVERRGRLARAAADAKEAERLARVRYEAGLDSFLDLLDSQSRLLDVEQQLAASEMQALLNLATLYQALGGGWPTDQEGAEKAASASEKARAPAKAPAVKQQEVPPLPAK